MSNVKQQVQALLDRLPATCSYEDVQYHLYVLEKIENGAQRARREGSISHLQAEKRLQKWRMK